MFLSLFCLQSAPPPPASFIRGVWSSIKQFLMSEEGQINISINTVIFSNIRLLKPANLGAGLKVSKGFRAGPQWYWRWRSGYLIGAHRTTSINQGTLRTFPRSVRLNTTRNQIRWNNEESAQWFQTWRHLKRENVPCRTEDGRCCRSFWGWGIRMDQTCQSISGGNLMEPIVCSSASLGCWGLAILVGVRGCSDVSFLEVTQQKTGTFRR